MSDINVTAPATTPIPTNAVATLAPVSKPVFTFNFVDKQVFKQSDPGTYFIAMASVKSDVPLLYMCFKFGWSGGQQYVSPGTTEESMDEWFFTDAFPKGTYSWQAVAKDVNGGITALKGTITLVA